MCEPLKHGVCFIVKSEHTAFTAGPYRCNINAETVARELARVLPTTVIDNCGKFIIHKHEHGELVGTYTLEEPNGKTTHHQA